MWQSEVTLISEEYEFDEIGNQIPILIEEEVFCNVKSISRSEFYNAATTGLKPSLVFKVRIVDYNDQEKIKFEDNEYKIIRTYIVDTENIELTCEKVLGNA